MTEPRITLNIRLPPWLVDELDRRAARTHTSRNTIITLLLIHSINQERKEDHRVN